MLASRTIRAWRAVHTWTSLVCTAFLLVLCLTGLPLIFHDEIDGWLAHEPPYPALAAPTPNASLDRMASAARQAHPGQFIRYVFLDDDAPQVAILLAPNRDGPPHEPHRITFDARTGSIRQDELTAPGGPDVMAFVLRLHAFLLAGLPGELLLGVMGLLFLGALVSGAVLYAPFMRKLAFGTVRKGGSGRLAWLDRHNLVGIAALAWMTVVGATGVLNTLSTPLFGIWQLTDVARILRPYERQVPVDPVASLQGAVETARGAVPGGTLASITYPAHFQSSPAHYVVWLKGDRTLTSRLLTPVLVDARTGRLAQVVRMPWYLRALETSRPLHFGDYGGVALKGLWALLDLLTITVLVSGLYLWWAKRRSRARSADLIEAEVEAGAAEAAI
jgi:uncharacterized iron-regulated membrane protein